MKEKCGISRPEQEYKRLSRKHSHHAACMTAGVRGWWYDHGIKIAGSVTAGYRF